MPLYNSHQLLSDLHADVSRMTEQARMLAALPPAELNRQPAPGKWCVAQVAEHLNSYNRYYLPEIKKALQQPGQSAPVFRPGWFGNYFTNMMKPKGGQVGNKMTAPKGHRPEPELDAPAVLAAFISGQEQLLKLLEQARQADIGKLRVPISISRMIKLKLGDTFRFLVAHQERHFVQISNVLATLGVEWRQQ